MSFDNSAGPNPHELAQRLASILARVASACRRVGRQPEDVVLVAVSKTFPISFVQAARAVGQIHFGENRPQELHSKASVLPGRVRGGDVCWHMIGHVQRNKARVVVEHAELVHGVDSIRLAEALNGKAVELGRVVPCLVQVNTSGEVSKFGIAPDALNDFLRETAAFRNLDVCGLMTIARPVDDPELVRPEFRLLRTLMDSARGRVSHGDMRYLSMGMSGDFEVAIEEGATHIRIGTSLFGTRN